MGDDLGLDGEDIWIRRLLPLHLARPPYLAQILVILDREPAERFSDAERRQLGALVGARQDSIDADGTETLRDPLDLRRASLMKRGIAMLVYFFSVQGAFGVPNQVETHGSHYSLKRFWSA